jgi:hypothetical protein
MQVHDNALNLTSEPRKKWTWKVQYFFMKIHAFAWQCIESHIWTKKKVNFEISIFFHENSCKCMTMHWISHLNQEKSELWKFNIFLWKFIKVHKNSCKCMTMHWISHVNQEKSELWKFNIFSWKFMQVHDNALNLTSEPRKKWTLKVQYFFMKIYKSA